jgi:hypothetical protein
VSAKRFLILVGIMLLALVSLISTLFFYIDPLFLYRKTELYEPQYAGTERYQMAGLLNTIDYRTVFTGTSMGRNFEEAYADEKLATKSFNASLPASTAREQSMVVETAFRQKGKLDRVIWELNHYSFSGEPDWVKGPPSDFPVYMYDQSKLNDIRYLFNSYTVEVLYKNLVANQQDVRARRNPLTLYKFGKGAPIESYERIEGALESISEMSELPEFETAETMLRSFKNNVLSLVESHPETTFTFFFAPYSVYNQYIYYQYYYEEHPDYLTERVKFKEEAYKLLSQYPNTQLYDFQATEQVTFNIDNYMGDGVHYYQFVNRWIIDYIADHPPITNLAQYKNLINKYLELVTNFKPEQLENNTTLREKYQL